MSVPESNQIAFAWLIVRYDISSQCLSMKKCPSVPDLQTAHMPKVVDLCLSVCKMPSMTNLFLSTVMMESVV